MSHVEIWLCKMLVERIDFPSRLSIVNKTQCFGSPRPRSVLVTLNSTNVPKIKTDLLSRKYRYIAESAMTFKTLRSFRKLRRRAVELDNEKKTPEYFYRNKKSKELQGQEKTSDLGWKISSKSSSRMSCLCSTKCQYTTPNDLRVGISLMQTKNRIFVKITWP